MREVSEAMGVTTSTVSQQIAALALQAGTPGSTAAWSASLSAAPGGAWDTVRPRP